ncbi:T9SS type A sorting domain-containing protein [Maribellus comscasis]|nr:T9SS type A sorting domain-containing protein [Maribellus comscasis]
MKQKFIFLTTIILLFAHTIFSQNVGETAPDFTLKTLNEINYTLSDNKGKVVFVFLVGYNCPLCIASAPTIKSDILDVYNSNSSFQALIIDTWDGSAAAFTTFKNTTNLSGIYLQKGKSVADNWSSTYDRIIVIDAEGTMVFKGTTAASSDADDAAAVIESALNNISTPVTDLSGVDKFSVSQNYPNPCTKQTKIEYAVSKPVFVKFSIIDITGKLIEHSFAKHHSVGKYSIDLNTSKLEKGIYFYRFEAGDFLSIRKMIVN